MKEQMPSMRKLTALSAIAALSLGSVGAQAMLPMIESALEDNIFKNAAMLQPTGYEQTGYRTSMAAAAPSAPINQGSAQNNSQNSIQVKTVAAVVDTNSQGQSVLKPVDANTRLSRGDIIEYQTSITNASPDRVESMTVTTSIPAQVKLVGEIAPNTASASLDGKNFNRMPLRGKMGGQIQDIPLSYYKYLQWTVEDLGLNETKVVKYRTTYK